MEISHDCLFSFVAGAESNLTASHESDTAISTAVSSSTVGCQTIASPVKLMRSVWLITCRFMQQLVPQLCHMTPHVDAWSQTRDRIVSSSVSNETQLSTGPHTSPRQRRRPIGVIEYVLRLMVSRTHLELVAVRLSLVAVWCTSVSLFVLAQYATKTSLRSQE
jgi:hypothetical protein